MEREVIVNDIDGDTFHTVDCGLASEVMARYVGDSQMQTLIRCALRQGVAQGPVWKDGEMFLVKVVAKEPLSTT